MKKVLLIVDNDITQERWSLHLVKHAQVLQAYSLADAYSAMQDHADISVFVVDGFIGPEKNEHTLDLIKDILGKYPNAQLVAAASDWRMRQDQRKNGCQTEAEDKDYVPANLISLLKGT